MVKVGGYGEVGSKVYSSGLFGSKNVEWEW